MTHTKLVNIPDGLKKQIDKHVGTDKTYLTFSDFERDALRRLLEFLDKKGGKK